MKFVIPGNPMPQARPRIAKRGRFTMMYDPQAGEKRIIANRILWQIKQVIEENTLNFPLVGEIKVDLYFYLPIPKSDNLSQKNHKLWGLSVPCHKPDADNLIKGIFDSCNKILYKDDAQIVKGSFEKRYSDNPRTEFTIMALGTQNDEEIKDILGIYGPHELRGLCELMETIQSTVYGIKDVSDFGCDPDAKFLVANMKRLAEDHGPLLQKINKLSKKKASV